MRSTKMINQENMKKNNKKKTWTMEHRVHCGEDSSAPTWGQVLKAQMDWISTNLKRK